MEQNEQLDLAFNFVQFTDRNIFLTGKAGTGKTTFLHNLKKTSHKRMAVVAPTGVAAINAGGVTIHSFFQMPFGPYVAGNKTTSQKRFNRDKINLIRSLDLLVIDEISMVRADTLDGIDETLRRYKDHNKPFGGVQLLMIGDLHQLSPVVKDDDWKILKDFYPNLYFFSSRALQKTDPVNIELKHIYRQADTFFIDLLNKVRNNEIDGGVLARLNERYIPSFEPDDEQGYITLTTHNKLADEINRKKLAGISTPPATFTAVVHNDFPEYAYPTVFELEIKTGAQVMFVKNDPSRERLFYNGKIGRVVKIDDDVIYVKCPGDSHEIAVEQLSWENIRYELNAETKEIEEKTIGSFTQYPLKLAWAITIHKSQGLTFEKAIIDANSAFAHGQVYVALSRCKSFEGLVLSSPISSKSVKTDGTVAEYTKNADENTPTEQHLLTAKIAYQQSLICELFDFRNIKIKFFELKRTIENNYTGVTVEPDDLELVRTAAEKDIYEVADTFRKYLEKAFLSGGVPEEQAPLQDKIRKACVYFHEKVTATLRLPLQKITIDTDNKAVRTSIAEGVAALNKEITIKLALTAACKDGFDTLSYLRAKSDTEIDSADLRNTRPLPDTPNRAITHPLLYASIKKWRDDLAEKSKLPVYRVLRQKSIVEISNILPADQKQLENIKGLGKIKIKQYGSDLLAIITAYCREHNIQPAPTVAGEVNRTKADTKKISFDLFKSGKKVEEIATLRGFTRGTIEGHLAHFISTGGISVFDLVSKPKVAEIMSHLIRNPGFDTSEYKAALGESVSYGELRAVMNHLGFVRSGAEVKLNHQAQYVSEGENGI